MSIIEPIPGAYEGSTDLYLVDGEYYRTGKDSFGVSTYAQQLVGRPSDPEVPIQMNAQEFSNISRGWTWLDKAQTPGADLRVFMPSVDSLIANLGPLAAQDPSMQRLFAGIPQGEFLLPNGEMDVLALETAYRQTDYYNSTTNKARQWGQSSDADRAVQVANELSTIAEMWRLYTGQNVTLPDTMAELDDNPVFKGWLTKAYQLAQGNINQATLLNKWLHPIAEQIEGSPWSRRLLEEERAGKQEVIDLETKKGEIRDVGNRYGLSLSNEMVTKYGNDIINNELSDEELEQKLDEQSLVLYPNKPIGMDWVTYADPWRRVHAELYETSMPDHTDSDLAKALADGSSLSDYRTTIRKSNRWLGTENARDSLISELSLAGRRMGFG